MITSYFKAKRSLESSANARKVKSPNQIGIKHQLNDDTVEIDGTEITSSKKGDAKRLKRTDLSTTHTDKSNNISSPEAVELMSHLKDESWRIKITHHVSKPPFIKLAKFVATERTSKIVYPPPCDVFSALNSVSVDKVKVVIVGQDPYHQPNQGHGLSFSVRKGVRIPPSLRNIYKELLKSNCGFDKMPTHGNLEQWCAQGVLLLNSVLTVRKGEANSHAKQGWENFTDEIIRILVNNRKRSLVFLLWGKPASKKAETIINKFGGNTRHKIISTSHPSPLGALKTKTPFLGSDCFNRANDALIEMGQQPIDWRIDQ